MQTWQVQEAKAQLTKVINDAQNEPQIISKRGIPTAVVISFEEFTELFGQKENIVQYFQDSPLYGIDLDVMRDKSLPKEIDL